MTSTVSAEQAAQQRDIAIVENSDPAGAEARAAYLRIQERIHRAELATAAAARLAAEKSFIAAIKEYVATVKAAVADAGKAKPGPVTPTARNLARQILHSRNYAEVAAAPGLLDPVVANLLATVMHGQSLINRAETADTAVLESLYEAEGLAWKSLCERAKQVAGEA